MLSCCVFFCAVQLSSAQFMLHSVDVTFGSFVRHNGSIESDAFSKRYVGINSNIQCVRRFVLLLQYNYRIVVMLLILYKLLGGGGIYIYIMEPLDTY